MSDAIEVHKSYPYRLYRSDKKDHRLRHMIFVASTIWNHFSALQRRCYQLTGKYISLNEMNVHILKRPAFALWKDLHLQGMKALRGRKVSDLGSGKFMTILAWIAFKRGKTVVKIDRFTPAPKFVMTHLTQQPHPRPSPAGEG